jgi:hypothetical protein
MPQERVWPAHPFGSCPETMAPRHAAAWHHPNVNPNGERDVDAFASQKEKKIKDHEDPPRSLDIWQFHIKYGREMQMECLKAQSVLSSP